MLNARWFRLCTWLKLKYHTGQNAFSRQPCEIFIPKFLGLCGRDPATILYTCFHYTSRCPDVPCQHGLVRRAGNSIAHMHPQRHHMGLISLVLASVIRSNAPLLRSLFRLSICQSVSLSVAYIHVCNACVCTVHKHRTLFISPARPKIWVGCERNSAKKFASAFSLSRLLWKNAIFD